MKLASDVVQPVDSKQRAEDAMALDRGEVGPVHAYVEWQLAQNLGPTIEE